MAAVGGAGTSAKNLRKHVRLTCNHRVLHARQHGGGILVNQLHTTEIWPHKHGAVVYMRGRPHEGIYVTERLATIERRVHEALEGAE